ncbi:hypothetical protein GCM10010442_66680 [Kitasatospora kifunensis]
MCQRADIAVGRRARMIDLVAVQVNVECGDATGEAESPTTRLSVTDCPDRPEVSRRSLTCP